ncbi:MAG: SLC13 family permease [Phycisphaerae bacterium]|nr:SLC13 family permease [Phycisphaerae bacterium]
MIFVYLRPTPGRLLAGTAPGRVSWSFRDIREPNSVGLNWKAWYTIAVMAITFVGLMRGLPTDVMLIGAALLVALAGIITPDEMFSGFSNQGMLTVGALFVVSAALRETGALDRLGRLMLGKVHSERHALLVLAPQVAGLSAFLNNTAVVAMLVNVVGDWCRKNRISPSRLLMPLSYLSILGGMCTLIGTSTNLLVNGLMIDAAQLAQTDELKASLREFSLFELGKIGVPMVIVGVAYLWFVGQRLLPNRRDIMRSLDESARHYLANMRIEPGCPLIGRKVEAAGLRRLPGLFLIEIVRDGRVIAPVEPDEVLLERDLLTFTGEVDTIVDLERIRGFVAVTSDEPDQALPGFSRRYCEAVVSGTSPLLEQTIRDANFRARYNAAVIAVHRGGTRLTGRVGDIVLRPGDTLLLQTGPHFASAHRNSPSFFLVSSLEEARPVRHSRTVIALALLGMLVTLMAFKSFWQVPTVMAAFLVGGLMIGTRCISASDARRAIPWNVLLTIAAAFGLGHALVNSGVASALASSLVGITREWGAWAPVATLAAIYLMTALCTETITNNAAAVLMFPFGIAAATDLGVDPRPFAVAVAIAASASFATPIGYQTNMMVYGPGGYRFRDFVRVGLPLNIVTLVLATWLIPRFWPM